MIMNHKGTRMVYKEVPVSACNVNIFIFPSDPVIHATKRSVLAFCMDYKAKFTDVKQVG